MTYALATAAGIALGCGLTYAFARLYIRAKVNQARRSERAHEASARQFRIKAEVQERLNKKIIANPFEFGLCLDRIQADLAGKSWRLSDPWQGFKGERVCVVEEAK